MSLNHRHSHPEILTWSTKTTYEFKLLVNRSRVHFPLLNIPFRHTFVLTVKVTLYSILTFHTRRRLLLLILHQILIRTSRRFRRNQLSSCTNSLVQPPSLLVPRLLNPQVVRLKNQKTVDSPVSIKLDHSPTNLTPTLT